MANAIRSIRELTEELERLKSEAETKQQADDVTAQGSLVYAGRAYAYQAALDLVLGYKLGRNLIDELGELVYELSYEESIRANVLTNRALNAHEMRRRRKPVPGAEEGGNSAQYVAMEETDCAARHGLHGKCSLHDGHKGRHMAEGGKFWK